MRKSLNRVASIATSIAMVGSMLLTGVPAAHAADATIISDTMSRLAVNATATHVLRFISPAFSASSTWETGETVTFTYTGWNGGTGTPSVNSSVGTVVASPMAASVLTLTCTAGPCDGSTIAVGNSGIGFTAPFSLNNPGGVGSATVTIGGTGGVTGSYSVPIMDSDQVTVTASVAVAVTFDIDTQAGDDSLPNADQSDAPYNVNLGVITLADTRVSGTVDGVNYIMLDLTSNAQGGTVVTVQNANGANGLVSASGPDNINSADGTMTPGIENYGLCSQGADVEGTGSSGTFTAVAPFDGSCLLNANNHVVGGLTGTAQPIYTTNTDPITLGRAMIAVNADISTSTASHNDYQDTLTFIATGTF